MRCFVAIELPAKPERRLADRVEALRPRLPAARWVAAGNRHLTLLFLGEIGDSRATALAARLAPVFGRRAAFDLQLAGGGSFPPRGSARVVWVGLAPGAGREALLELQAAVARAGGEELGLAADGKPYRPHLTVARCRRPWPAAAAQSWREGLAGPVGDPFPVRQGVMVESRLTATGPVYRPLRRLPLEAAA